MTRSIRNRRLEAIATGVVAGLFAASCMSSNPIDAPSVPAGAVRGGRLVVGISEPTAIEPSNAADPSATLVVRTMCDPLVQADPRTGRLVGAIAESWQVSDGGTRVTVKLRKGVRFHDGSELTADDAVFSLSRAASEEAASPLAPLLRPIDGYRQVRGEEEVDEPRNREVLSGLRVIEKYSFEMKLVDAHADMIDVLAHPLASPVPKKLVQRDPIAFAARPVCAGPYQLTAPWQPGSPAITLRRFPGYKPVNEGYSGAGHGYAEEIEFRILADQAAELSEFETGNLDVAHVPRDRHSDAVEAYGDMAVVAPAPRLLYLGLPTRVAPFDRREVRGELSRVLNRRDLAGAVEGGAAAPARGFLPPAVGAAHRPTGCGRLSPIDPDLSTTRNSLGAARSAGEEVRPKLYFNDEFGNRSVAEAIAAQWRATLNIEVDLVPQSWEAHLALATSPAGFDGPFLMSWAGPYPSPDAFLSPLFESNRIRSENFSHFADPTFDRLLQRVARREAGAEERALDYQQVEDRACGQMPIIPLAFEQSAYLVRRPQIGATRDSVTDLSSGQVLLRELYVAQGR